MIRLARAIHPYPVAVDAFGSSRPLRLSTGTTIEEISLFAARNTAARASFRDRI